MPDPTVLVAGAGPTGLAIANALGEAGVSTLVVEQDDGPTTEPRAVSIDDEAMRFLVRLGLGEGARQIAVPGTGTRYYGATGRLLAHARGPDVPPLGYPVKNPIDHPELQRLLLDGCSRFDCVHVAFGTRLTGLTLAGGHVVGELNGQPGATRRTSARFLLGCDGGRSTVRRLVEVSMSGSSFEQPWLVVDTTRDPHDELYAMHHGDPDRPCVIVPGRDGRCRYEFLVLPGERPEDVLDHDFIRGLVEAHRRDLTQADVVRSKVYTFHALVADAWRRGPILLLGDAAHMMPPFAGQGLNSGLRDAHNLAWKLVAVLDGRAGEQILDTYELERRAHAEATIRLSVRMGRVMMTTNRTEARVRDALVGVARRLSWTRRYIEEMRFRPSASLERGLLVGRLRGFVGRLLPPLRVLGVDGSVVRLDEVLGTGFALLAVDPDGDPFDCVVAGVWERLRARQLIVRLDGGGTPAGSRAPIFGDVDGALQRLVGEHRGELLVVRPDRYVAAAFEPAEEPEVAAQLEDALGYEADAGSSSRRLALPS